MYRQREYEKVPGGKRKIKKKFKSRTKSAGKLNIKKKFKHNACNTGRKGAGGAGNRGGGLYKSKGH